MEEIKDVVGFEGLYLVNMMGDVFSMKRVTRDGRTLKPKQLKPRSNGNGYTKLTLVDANGKHHNKKIHRIVAEAFLGLKKDEYVVHQLMMDDIIFTYAEIGSTLIEGEGKISCIPKEIKSDMVAYLKRKAQDYDEAGELAEVIAERVPNSSRGGRVSKPWLRRKGKTKADQKDRVQNNIGINF